MSATESFGELAARLKREREERPPAGAACHQPLPEPLRLPDGDPRRQRWFAPGRGGRQAGSAARKAGGADLPPPLFTGILPYKPTGVHKVTEWRWDPGLLYWIGRCSVCQYRFRADRETAGQLEREVAGWCAGQRDLDRVSPEAKFSHPLNSPLASSTSG